jgi:hypothetical protein
MRGNEGVPVGSKSVRRASRANCECAEWRGVSRSTPECFTRGFSVDSGSCGERVGREGGRGRRCSERGRRAGLGPPRSLRANESASPNVVGPRSPDRRDLHGGSREVPRKSGQGASRGRGLALDFQKNGKGRDAGTGGPAAREERSGLHRGEPSGGRAWEAPPSMSPRQGSARMGSALWTRGWRAYGSGADEPRPPGSAGGSLRAVGAKGDACPGIATPDARQEAASKSPWSGLPRRPARSSGRAGLASGLSGLVVSSMPGAVVEGAPHEVRIASPLAKSGGLLFRGDRGRLGRSPLK